MITEKKEKDEKRKQKIKIIFLSFLFVSISKAEGIFSSIYLRRPAQKSSKSPSRKRAPPRLGFARVSVFVFRPLRMPTRDISPEHTRKGGEIHSPRKSRRRKKGAPFSIEGPKRFLKRHARLNGERLT